MNKIISVHTSKIDSLSNNKLFQNFIHLPKKVQAHYPTHVCTTYSIAIVIIISHV